MDQARTLVEKINQINYVNPYDKKHIQTKGDPEVNELHNIISANC